MDIKKLTCSLVLSCVSFITVSAGGGFSATEHTASMRNQIDPNAFLLVKNDLKVAQELLIQIRDSSNPAITTKALHGLERLFKETLYIGSATALGGGCVAVGVAMLMGEDMVGKLLKEPQGQGLALIAFPIAAFSIIFTYAFLKILFGRILASDDSKVTTDIKVSLVLLEQTINKLDYEIASIDRLYQKYA